MTEQEYSDEDDLVHRYDNKSSKNFTPAFGDEENIEAISKHIEKHVGKIDVVFHEIVSDLVHLDVHWVKPSKQFPFQTLVTSGMSDKPMSVPAGFDLEEYRYAELCILLPENWILEGLNDQTNKDNITDEKNYWPIRWLKTIARFPHEYNTWLGYGHTIPNGEGAAPFAENTAFGCMILMPSLSLGGRFYTLKINREKTIHFHCLYPLYKEEMDFKLKEGFDALLQKFDLFNVTDIVDIKRPNTCL
ncbi:suppressor of fused domain protein [Niabella ginsengisoli]|uniref:Suppressor of fused domain protein n=1 Tax=Niabella ginsengisoli TaxID=522298 RepID=A0ABS9SDT3_9BACT|nr:suppressor of fused domain protein [Niabella ginsengisoli]MCH5596516.1 suppressor of fused domain protein [Niabella ginsengisoli]